MGWMFPVSLAMDVMTDVLGVKSNAPVMLLFSEAATLITLAGLCAAETVLWDAVDAVMPGLGESALIGVHRSSFGELPSDGRLARYGEEAVRNGDGTGSGDLSPFRAESSFCDCDELSS